MTDLTLQRVIDAPVERVYAAWTDPELTRASRNWNPGAASRCSEAPTSATCSGPDGGNAMYHLLRDDEFDARRALALGFVQEVVPAGDQINRALELAEEICECAPLAVQEIKRAAQVHLEEGEAGRVPGDSRHARNDGELGGLRGGDRFVRRASKGDVPRALTGTVARGTGRERRAAGLHRGRERLAALDLAEPRRLRGQAGAHSLGPEGHSFRRKELERWKSALRDVEIHEIEDCAHFAAEEAPGSVEEAVQGFMGRS